MKTIIILAGILPLLLSHGFANDVKAPSVAERDAGAKTALEDANTIAIYAKGLCCSSCAIGIRKYLSKLPFVDTKRLKKGVDLDAKAQLAIVAMKPGALPDEAAIVRAIRKAGYAPEELYRNKAGRIAKTFLPAE